MSLSLSPLQQLPAPLEGYTLIERLGRGGFGEVWKAEAPGGLLKAIKFVFGDLDTEDDEENRPARQEEKSLKRVKNIRHPYVLSLERYDKIEGQLVIVMELADRNLWDRFRECHALGMPGIPRDELLRYMDETAEALDLMNNHYSIQHLDVKPQNLFLVFNHVKVGDFGLAKVLEGVRGTITGGVTPVYAGPETFNGDVSRFTDQYSLAIVFQEMLTGRRPFNGSNTKQLVMQHLTGLPDLEPLPVGDRDVIGRGLAKEPEQRWPSCSEMVRALRQTGPTITTPAPINLLRKPAPAPQAATVMPTPQSSSSTIGGMRTVNTAAVAKRYGPQVLAEPGAIVSTPLPSLVTPRLVTQQGASHNGTHNPAMTLARPVVMNTAKMSSLGVAEPERAESGVLMPALIIGLGETGLRVVQQSRSTILERFGSLEAAPHIRFLAIDTDPEAANAAISPNNPHALPPNEMIAARLNRPGHYIQREGIPAVDQWMPSGTLYKLPRDPRPASGVRAFGRLALIDNYRSIAQRIRQTIETFVTDDALNQAAAKSSLGVRTNRARVYIAANLAGGTGGGMALDLAFIVRHELRQIGYTNPDCVGMLFVPAVDGGKGVPMANAYAALKELGHFHRGRNRYITRFDNAEPPISDGDGPFRRVALLQLPRRPEAKELQRSAGLAARAIYLDLFTPTGRRCDDVRVEADRLNESKVPVVQPFGLFRLSWPRPAVLAASTRCFAQRLVQRWLTKDAGHLREPIQTWLDENWQKRQLSLEEVVGRFHKSVREHLNEDPEKVFAAFVEPLRSQALASRMEPQAAADVIHRVLGIVGKPDDQDQTGTIQTALTLAYKTTAKEIEGVLFNWTGWFVEQPLYRLPGAEEAVAQITERVKRTLAALEPSQAELQKETSEGYSRILNLLRTLTGAGRGVIGPSRSTVGVELLDATLQYSKKRVTLLVLDATLALYRGLTNVLPDCLRDVAELRKKLTEISQTVIGAAEPVSSPGPGRMILPHGVPSLDAAADLFIGSLPAQDILEFEKLLQADMTKKFGGVVGLCTKVSARGDFVPWIATVSREFLDERLDTTDPAAVFFRHKELGHKTDKLLMQAFEDAAPEITSTSGRAQTEASILAGPPSPDGERFRKMVEALVPEASMIPATLYDDIVFFREYPLLPLAEVPQLSPMAKEAYDYQLAAEQSPHCRTDVAWN